MLTKFYANFKSFCQLCFALPTFELFCDAIKKFVILREMKRIARRMKTTSYESDDMIPRLKDWDFR